MLSINETVQSFEEHILPSVIETYSEDDVIAINEAWHNYTDSLCKDGELHDLQYHHFPAFSDLQPCTVNDIDLILDGEGFRLECEFVPASNFVGYEWRAKSLNWSVKLMKGQNQVLETTYSQGIGHLPTFDHSNRKQWYADNVEEARETGYFAETYKGLPKEIPAPDVADVMHSLLSDSDAMEYTFADWCSEFDYSADSIKAADTYHDCITHGLTLQRSLGGSEVLEWFRCELFGEY